MTNLLLLLSLGNRVGIFVKDDIELLGPYVNGFSVMTYDYSNIQRPGPNSPLKWVKECVNALVPNPMSPLRKKLLIGLNFYGPCLFYGRCSLVLERLEC